MWSIKLHGDDMKYIARFYTLGSDKQLVEGLGSHSVAYFDGRLSKSNASYYAYSLAKDRSYFGYRLYKGDTMSDAKPVSDLVAIYWRN